MGRKTRFSQSAAFNAWTYDYYLERLINLAVSRFEWQNMPETCDARFLEITLLYTGSGILLYEPLLGASYSLRVLPGGPFDLYGYPINRVAYGYNGAQVRCYPDDSVIVYNNMLRKGEMGALRMFAHRLWEYDRVTDVNVASNKTPTLILCNENERHSMENLYMQYEGNERVIFGTSGLDTKAIQVLQTGAPFIADKLNELKNSVWNEALTYLGIYNVTQKNERVNEVEVRRQQGGTIASRNSGLFMRQNASDRFNQIAGTNIQVRYRDPEELFEEAVEELVKEQEVETNGNQDAGNANDRGQEG